MLLNVCQLLSIAGCGPASVGQPPTMPDNLDGGPESTDDGSGRWAADIEWSDPDGETPKAWGRPPSSLAVAGNGHEVQLALPEPSPVPGVWRQTTGEPRLSRSRSPRKNIDGHVSVP